MKIIETEEIPFHTLSYLQVNSMREIKSASLPFFKVYVDGLPEELEGLVATADLQGRTNNGELLGVAVSKELELLSELDELPGLNKMGVVLCGDFYAHETLDKRGGSGNVSGVWRSFSSKFHWVAGVAGNHDLFSKMNNQKADDIFVKTPHIHFLNSSWIDMDTLRIAGISGIIGNTRKPFRITEKDFTSALKTIFPKKPDLLLLHEGPDVPDQGCLGHPLIRKELDKARFPLLVMSGHVQWEPLMIQISEQVTLLNVHERVVILLHYKDINL